MSRVTLNTDYSQFELPSAPNPMYQVSIASQDITVNAYLPEKIGFSVTSQFDTPFSQGFFPKVVSDASKMAGTGNLVNQGMTAQIWQGAGNVELSMSLIFYADKDPWNDVVTPIMNLCRLCMPSKGAMGMLQPPGPSLDLTALVGWAKNTTALPSAVPSAPSGSSGYAGLDTSILKNNIYMRIGQFLYFPSIVITAVQQSYDTRFDKAGLPVYAEVDLSVSLFMTPTKEDLTQIFGSSSQTQGERSTVAALNLSTGGSGTAY